MRPGLDPRPYAVGALAEVLAHFPHIGPVLPAMGYSEAQIRDLAAAIANTPADLVLFSTPIHLCRLVTCNKTHHPGALRVPGLRGADVAGGVGEEDGGEWAVLDTRIIKALIMSINRLILGLKFSYNFLFYCGKLPHVEKKIAFRPKALAANLKEARK